MKKVVALCISLFGLVVSLAAQSPLTRRPSDYEIAQTPVWAQHMYAAHPNVWDVDTLYRNYYRNHLFQKDNHTQYYKRWRRSINDLIDANGFVVARSQAELAVDRAAYAGKTQTQSNKITAGNWSVVGPLQVRNNSGVAFAEHTNTYSLARCASNANIMFCGTEPGEIYKSTDAGLSWFCVSYLTQLDGGVTALEVNPTNPNIVFAGSGAQVFRSTNGGNTWGSVIALPAAWVNEIKVNPANTNIVFACTDRGLWRSTDGGASFTNQFSNNDAVFDLKWHVSDPAKAFMVKDNPTLIQAEFYTSNDTGATWQLQSNGWYSSTDPNRTDQGARIAVTPADPNRVYCYLIGEAKANDVGFIGLYRSDDGGLTWTLPNGPAGGPYTTAHPNLARGTTTWQYHQGFYNCALMASATHADSILIGGLNLWRSDDGGLTFSVVSGYMPGGTLSMHVDNQDFRAFGNDYWITTDGGIYHGSDFFATQPDVQMTGVHGAEYWGFGQGWNEDVLVGGMYHNGNNAFHQNYPSHEFLALGGGEASTGYVNPGMNRKTYFSDIGGRLLPLSIVGTVTGVPFGLAPNETYYSAESSELEFHPNCYNIAYLGNEHKLWKTIDGGGAFNLVHTFGSDPNSQIKYLEISRSNPDIIYLNQQPASGNNGTLWKTTDGGVNWAAVSLPSTGNKRRMLLALDPDDANVLWLALPSASNGNKIWKTTNSGSSWTNLSTSLLDNENVHSIAHVGGTAGGVYFCTDKTVYYRDDNMSNWVIFNTNLPLEFNTNIARPFYRDGKLRIASYGKGIWESAFETAPSRPICTPMANALTAICSADTFFFEDHSMLNHLNATWNWSFAGGNPATSTLRNPAVTFVANGNHLVVLTVTDGNGVSDTDSMTVTLTGVSTNSLATDFETNFPPTGYTTAATGNLSWAQAAGVGGYGNSATASKCDNFNVDGAGTSADLRAYVNFSNIASPKATFDVAYAEYGGQYTDTLEVLASLDCGLTFTRLYRKGGQSLATAPNLTANEFVPANNEWRTDTVDLSAFAGGSTVVVVFRSIGHFGQTMYLDNINIAGNFVIGLPPTLEPDFVHVAPNPVLADGAITLRSNRADAFQLRLYDLQGKVLGQYSLRNGDQLQLEKIGLAAGNYYYMVSGETLMERGKLVVLKGR